MNAKAKEIIKDIAESTTSRIKVEQLCATIYRELMVEVQVNSNTASRGKSPFYGTLDEFCQKLGGKTLSEIA